MPCPSNFTRWNDQLPIVWETSWAPELVQTGQKNLAPPVFDPWSAQPIASHRTDCAVQKLGEFRIHATKCWEELGHIFISLTEDIFVM